MHAEEEISTDILTPALLLQAYRTGAFPMSDGRTSDMIYWMYPEKRGVMPLDGFHLSRSLARTLKQEKFTHSINHAFKDVVENCAAPAPNRETTWINLGIQKTYEALHQLGKAHSVESWFRGTLVGGLYGVALGSAFFAESMFSHVPNASKVALAHLIIRLRKGNFRLLDTQFLTPHLARLGGVEIKRNQYQIQLARALEESGDFNALDATSGSLNKTGRGAFLTTTVSGPDFGKCIVQLMSHTS